jgi:hypothetical protein
VYNIISMDWIHLILTDSVSESPTDTTHWNSHEQKWTKQQFLFNILEDFLNLFYRLQFFFCYERGIPLTSLEQIIFVSQFI